jgi:N-acetylmuramoyl-L-alanine amidase
MANLLSTWITHLCEPFDVMLTRAAAEPTSLEERGNRTNIWQADFCLHLHVNAAPGNRHQHGAEAYYWPGNAIGREVSDAILRAMPPPLHVGRMATSVGDKPGSQDDWLKNARAVMEPHACPSALIEIGYSTNLVDLDTMLDPAAQSAICSALLCGVLRLRQMKGK